MRTTVFRTALIGWIWLVTAVDIWCCQWLTLDAELNPIGVALIAEFGVWGMVAAKVVGTWLATEWLRYLHIGYSVFAAAVMLLLLLVLGGVIPV